MTAGQSRNFQQDKFSEGGRDVLEQLMKIKVITCAVLEKELELCASRSGNEVDIHMLEQGLHNTPDELRRRVQEAIDEADGQGFDGIVLGYGLCSRGVVGLRTARTKLVVPRGHDCITLLLGSKEWYREYFDTHPGVYWYSSGWIKHNNQPSRERYKETRAEYVEKYGEDNAEYLMEVQETWVKNYQLATYVDWGWPESAGEKEFTKRCAEEMGWGYDELSGQDGLLQRLLSGEWREEEALVLAPGEEVAESFDESIIRVKED